MYTIILLKTINLIDNNYHFFLVALFVVVTGVAVVFLVPPPGVVVDVTFPEVILFELGGAPPAYIVFPSVIGYVYPYITTGNVEFIYELLYSVVLD